MMSFPEFLEVKFQQHSKNIHQKREERASESSSLSIHIYYVLFAIEDICVGQKVQIVDEVVVNFFAGTCEFK